jgi:branched-chain amino acid aminotransferase
MDQDLDVITPPLDGTILPGVTRASVISLCDLFNTQASLRQFISSPAVLSTKDQKDKEYLGTPSGKSAPQSTLSSPSSPYSSLPTEIDSGLHTPTSISLPSLSSSFPKLHIRESTIKLADLERLAAAGTLRECFGSGTAAVICPVGKIGVLRSKPGSHLASGANEDKEVIEDIVLPEYDGGLGPVAGAMYRALVAIYEGRVEVEGWSVPCSC